MKILHTADWHLGVKTNGIDRLDEQKKVLEEILSIANYESVDIVIIAGDVFNVSNPSADAEELFFDTIEKLSAGGDRFIFVLAGNHDDPTRIEAGLPLASKHNIALVGDLTELKQDSFNIGSIIRVSETGKGYLKLEKENETITLAYLPYPSEARITEKLEGELEYAEKVRKWANVGAVAFSEDSLNIFVSHLFMVGAKTKDSEVKVGDILAVSKSYLPNADYTALGHLHTPQTLGDNVYYSGAITALTANQNGLGVNIIETDNNKIIDVKNIKLQNLAKYEKIVAYSIEDAEHQLMKYDDKDIVELEIIQSELIESSLLKELKREFPCLSNITLIRNTEESFDKPKENRRLLGDVDLFKNFYKSVRGFEASNDLVDMFNMCIGEDNETN